MSQKSEDKTSVAPPPTNRGAERSCKTMISDCIVMENRPKKTCKKNSRKMTDFSTDFDWYQGSIFFQNDDLLDDPETLETLLAMIEQDIREIFSDCVLVANARSINKYSDAVQYNDPQGNRLLLVEWGRNAGVHFTASGYHSRDLVPMLQSYGVLVTRADVAHDVYQYPQKFETVCKKIIKFAKEHGLQISQAGDWTEGGRRGRTLYIGSRSSRVYLCVYEKSFESGDEALINTYPDWFRFEFRFRPNDKETKKAIRKWTPFEYLGSSPWVKDLCQILKISLVESGSMRPPKKTDDFEIFCRNFFRQYKNTFYRLIEEKNENETFEEYVLRQIKRFA